MRVHRIAALLLALSGVSSADTRIVHEVTADRFATPQRVDVDGKECPVSVERPQSGDSIAISVGPGRVRRDQRGLTILWREDLDRLFFVYPQAERYSEFKLPLNYEKYLDEMAKRVGPELAQFHVEQMSGPEEVEIGAWDAKRCTGVVTNAMRDGYRVTFAYADASGVDAEPLARLETALHKLRFPAGSWIELLPAREGVTIVWEERHILPGTEILYREQVAHIEEFEPVDGHYDVPEGFKKIRYEPACVNLP